MENSADILQMPYLQLPLDKNFKKFMKLSRFKNLEEMLGLPVPTLLKMKGFNMRSLKHLYQLLEDHGLEKNIKTT